MTSTNELRQALAVGGAAREALRASWGDWADEFCNGLLLRLPELKDSYKIHLWAKDSHLTEDQYEHRRCRIIDTWQVNIDIGNTGAYTVDMTGDPLECIGRRISEQDMVRGADSGEARIGSADRADEEELRSVPTDVSEEEQEGGDDSPAIPGLFVHDL